MTEVTTDPSKPTSEERRASIARYYALYRSTQRSEAEDLEFATLGNHLERTLVLGDTPYERRVTAAVSRALHELAAADSVPIDEVHRLEMKRQIGELFADDTPAAANPAPEAAPDPSASKHYLDLAPEELVLAQALAEAYTQQGKDNGSDHVVTVDDVLLGRSISICAGQALLQDDRNITAASHEFAAGKTGRALGLQFLLAEVLQYIHAGCTIDEAAAKIAPVVVALLATFAPDKPEPAKTKPSKKPANKKRHGKHGGG